MKNISIILSCCLIFLSSCVSYITPAIGGNTSINYIPRPAYNDTLKSQIFGYGGFITQGPIDGHLSMTAGILNFGRGHSSKYLNFGYSGFGIIGRASFKDSTSLGLGTTTAPIGNFDKSFFGGGFRTTIGFQMVTNNKKFNFRILNWENAISFEGGSYQSYRKTIYEQPFDGGKQVIYVSNRNIVFTTGLSAEILWNQAFRDPDVQIGYRVFSGYSPKISESFKALNRSNKSEANSTSANFALFIKAKKFFYLSEFGIDNNYGLKFSLGYTF